MPKKNKGSFDYLNFAYGTGAAIVIVGAMFKFLGWNYANQMFLVGLTTEAIVFLISGIEFKTESSRLRWERVFPQLDPNFKGESQQIDLKKAQELYHQSTQTLVNNVGQFNETLLRLNDATSKLVDSVDRIGTGLERIENTTSHYETELEELRDKMQQLNTFYNQVNWVAGKNKEE